VQDKNIGVIMQTLYLLPVKLTQNFEIAFWTKIGLLEIKTQISKMVEE